MKNSWLQKTLTFFLVIVVLFASPSSALADVAPPNNPPGSNLQPGSDSTQIGRAHV